MFHTKDFGVTTQLNLNNNLHVIACSPLSTSFSVCL